MAGEMEEEGHFTLGKCGRTPRRTCLKWNLNDQRQSVGAEEDGSGGEMGRAPSLREKTESRFTLVFFFTSVLPSWELIPGF